MFLSDTNRYDNVSQRNFEKIPGCPIGYWVKDNILKSFSSQKLGAITLSDGQILTGDNTRFLRLFWETDSRKTGVFSGKKWTLMAKGGGYRKWYGNIIDTVNWSPEAREFYKKNKTARILDSKYWYREAVTWGVISTVHPSFRLLPEGYLFNKGGYSVFFNNDDNKFPIIGLLNSRYSEYILSLINPTLSTTISDVQSIPWILPNNYRNDIEKLSRSNIYISKEDWDAHETSWDFQCNELLSIDSDAYIDNINYEIEKHFEETGEHICIDPAAPQFDSLKWRMEQYKTKWERNFMQLHKNEEELNRQFIDIYGLQDELTPGVPLNEITILQQGEISIENNAIVWNDDVIIKQLISYAIGCWMGRYRLDKPGLNIAYYPEDKEICSYKYYGKSFTIDDDGIIPLMGGQNPFEDDNAIQKMVNFVHIVFGDERLTENLNFIEHSLGKSIEDYLTKDFWKDHKKMYQNRPIYWLFSSKKGAFQVLVYMHRMNPYTAEKVRTKYLLPYIEYLQTRIQQDNERGADLTTIERKNLTKMEAALVECQEYHDRLHSIADKQINFDLDDGVVVNYAKFGDVLAKIK